MGSFAGSAARNEKRLANPGAASLSAPPAPVGPSISAVKSHSPAGPFHLGDTITYSTTISNSGTDALNVNFSDTPDANTTLVGGSIHASPIAFDDVYNWVGNTQLDTSARGLASITSNDFAPTDTFTLNTTPTSSPAHGAVTISA